MAINVNCGYARVAMKTLNENEFKKNYQTSLCIDEDYYLQLHGKNHPQNTKNT